MVDNFVYIICGAPFVTYVMYGVLIVDFIASVDCKLATWKSYSKCFHILLSTTYYHFLHIDEIPRRLVPKPKSRIQLNFIVPISLDKGNNIKIGLGFSTHLAES